MPRKPIPSPCFARLTASRKIGTDPIFLKWEKWGLSLFFLLAGCAAAPLEPAVPGGNYFGLLGDTPYSADQVQRLDRLIDDVNAQPLAFVVHVGDIGTSAPAQACGDAWIEARNAQFGRIRHPFVLIPGDNEWSDCHQRGLDPAQRLAKWRSLFCFRETVKDIERQPGEYCEHLRWRSGDALFVVVNVPGNNNNARDPREQEARMRAVFAWLDDAEARATQLRLRLVILMHANPFVPRNGYRELTDRLAKLAARRPGQVALVHGDTHLYRNDEPLPGLHRVEVWGAPWVNWLRSSVTGGVLRVEQGRQY